VCCLYIGENSVEVKVEADDIPKCSHNEQPDNGMLDLYCYKCKKKLTSLKLGVRMTW